LKISESASKKPVSKVEPPFDINDENAFNAYVQKILEEENLEAQKRNEPPKTRNDVLLYLIDGDLFDIYLNRVLNGKIVVPEDGNDEKEFEEFLKEYLSGEIEIEEADDNKVSMVHGSDADAQVADPGKIEKPEDDSDAELLQKPPKLSPKMAILLTRIFENVRPIDIFQVRESYLGGTNGSPQNAPVSHQLRDLSRTLLYENIPDFIENLKDVINEHPENRIKKIIDNYGQNLEKALLAKNYDLNEQRIILGKNWNLRKQN
jgi:hypothetical protein